MSDTMPGAPASLLDRVKAIILKPKEEWPRIAAEPTSQGEILTGYVLILAAIGPVAEFLGSQIFGRSFLFVEIRPSFMGSLVSAIVSYVLAVVGIFILALIADFLAPKFDGQSSKLNAFKLAAYGATAFMVAQIFMLLPMLSFFVILGLYSFYLFFTGASPLMKVPQEKVLAYTVVVFLCAFVIRLILAAIVLPIVGLFGLGAAVSGASIGGGADEVTVNIPGVGSINTGEMEEAAERMRKIQSGEIKPATAEELQALLPSSIAGMKRTGMSSTALGQMGTGVEGKYTSDESEIQLAIRDMAGLGGFAGIVGAMGVQQTEEDEDGYERTGVFDGKWLNEKWDKRSKSGTYGILVAERFQVEASGRVDNIDVLKAAVAAVDTGDLEDLAE